MHEIQKKLLALSKSKNISELGYRKIGREIGVEHPQKVKFHLQQLQKKGFLKTDKSANVVKSLKQSSELQPKFIRIPVVGAANCGEAAIFADEKIEGYLNVSTSLTRKSRGLYALRAEGNSLNKANIQGNNIQHGDYVLVDYIDQNYAGGDYVVSVIEGRANIKKFNQDKKSGQVALLSESTEKHEPIYMDSDDNFVLTGKVKAVIKSSNLEELNYE